MNTIPRSHRSAAIASASLLAACLPASAAITFLNAGLDGTPGYGNAPTNWSGIPFGTTYSQATSANEAAPVLVGPTGPNVGNGFYGTPESGSTFATGINGTFPITGGFATYQQGLQQTVSGFTVGETYSFSFYQAVVKYSGGQDDTGSWKVFANGELVATTAPSTSSLAWNAPGKPLTWEERTVTFTATAETLNMAFLSYDPDGNITGSAEAVYMGIDSFSPINPVPEPSAAVLGLVGVLGLLRRRRA